MKSYSSLYLILTAIVSMTASQATRHPKKGDALLVIDVQNDFMAQTPLDGPLSSQKPSYDLPPSALTSDGKNIKAGSLAVQNTVEIIQDINCMIENFSSKKLPVFFSLDWHEPDHCSFGFNGTAESNPEFHHPQGTIAGPLMKEKSTEDNYPGVKNLCQDPRTQQDFDNPNLGAMQWPQHCIQQTFGSRFYPFLKVPQNAKVIKKGSEKKKDAYSAFNGFLSKQSFPFDTQDTASDLTSRFALKILLQQRRVKRLFIVGIATDYCVKSSAVDGKTLGFLKEVNVIVPSTRWVTEATKQSALAEMQAAGVTLSYSSPFKACPTGKAAVSRFPFRH